MKDKLNRLAKGIMDEDPPVLFIKPESFEEVAFSDRANSFTIELESLSGKNMGGVVACDEFRLNFASPSFLGRVAHVSFTVDASNLPDGHVLEGKLSLLTNAGEYLIPYRFTVRRYLSTSFGKNVPDAYAAGCVTEKTSRFEEENFENDSFSFGTGRQETAGDGYRRFLAGCMPEDEELFFEVCSMIIREEGDGELAFAFLNEAVRRGLPLTHLYESFLATWPENRQEAMPREVLLYFAYEKNLVPLAADRLYRSVIAGEPEGTELYLQYEPRMRDHAAKSLMDRRMNANLKTIYDRMIYPDMIDERTAAILPDILQSHRITVTEPEAVTVHVKYPELKRVISVKLKDGAACVPVYFADAEFTFYDASGKEVKVSSFGDEKLMDRPDLMRRCLSVNKDHPMLLFAEAKEILGRGAATEEDKEKLKRALSELDPEEAFKTALLRALFTAGGDASWTKEIPLKDLDPETGRMAFRSYLETGKRIDAYLYLRSTGMEGKDPKDLSAIATGLLDNDERPVTENHQTDRFFTCLCKRVFDYGCATGRIMEYLTEEYEGPSGEMAAVLKVADENSLPVNGLPERLLTVLLFTENRKYMDETFVIYLKKDVQKENLLRAFFTFRMTDYFEKGDRTIDPGVFEALTSYLGISRFYEAMPPVYLLGLTKHYSEREELTARETELCQKLTDLLIGKDLIFAYTKKLRKKIRIPGSICERFYVEYAGVNGSVPRMIARIFPDEEEYAPMDMRKVYRNVYVASTVLFVGDEMHYLVYDDAIGLDPVEQGVIHVTKMHGKEEDRFLQLNRMTKELADRDRPALAEDMLGYAVDTEVNSELFRIE